MGRVFLFPLKNEKIKIKFKKIEMISSITTSAMSVLPFSIAFTLLGSLGTEAVDSLLPGLEDGFLGAEDLLLSHDVRLEEQ